MNLAKLALIFVALFTIADIPAHATESSRPFLSCSISDTTGSPVLIDLQKAGTGELDSVTKTYTVDKELRATFKFKVVPKDNLVYVSLTFFRHMGDLWVKSSVGAPIDLPIPDNVAETARAIFEFKNEAPNVTVDCNLRYLK